MINAYAMVLLSAAAAGFAGSAIAAPTEATVAYTMANQRAAVDYKVARAKCNSLAGNLRAVCVAEARSARIHVEANAKAQYESSLSARTDAREAIADADYDVDKARCASKTGNAENVCIKEAKAALVSATAETRADKKVIEARVDARDDKQTADYKVAIEQFDK
ncbi:MAG TPA: hypothetical protein VMV33_01210 [Rhodocyclaceae bacterium]|nr:hypothetical protein [Rhodocyclaceae bacterium]